MTPTHHDRDGATKTGPGKIAFWILWTLAASWSAQSSLAQSETFAFDTVLDWRMQSLDQEVRPAYPADTAATLRLVGRVTIGPPGDDDRPDVTDDGVVRRPTDPEFAEAAGRLGVGSVVSALQLPESDRVEAVTFHWERIHYRERPARGSGMPGREWVLTDFDEEAVKRGVAEAATRWRPLLSFPQAAAYETEMLGWLLAYTHGRTVRLDLEAGMWDIAAPGPATATPAGPDPVGPADVPSTDPATPTDAATPGAVGPGDTPAPSSTTSPPMPGNAGPGAAAAGPDGESPAPPEGPALIAQWVRDAAPDWPGDQPFELYVGSIVPRLITEDWGTGTFGRYRFRDYGIDPRREGFEDQTDPWSPGYGRYERDFPLHRDDVWERDVAPRRVIRVGADGRVTGTRTEPRIAGGPLVGSGGVVGGVGGFGGRTRLGVVDVVNDRDPALPPAQAEAGAVFLPLSARLTGQLETHLRGLAQFARRPDSRQETLSTDIFAIRPALLARLGGESRVGETFRKRLLEHPAPTPAGSALAWMGWLPVDGAVVRDTRSVPSFLLDSEPRVKVDLPDDYLNLVLSQEYPDSYFLERAVDFAFGTAALKRQAGQRRDIRLLSDARRGKLTTPEDPVQQVVRAQQLREAEARQWLIANSDDPRFPVYRPADVARLNLEDLWIIQDHGIEHQAGAVPEALHEKLKIARDDTATRRSGARDAAPAPAAPAGRGGYVGGYRVRSVVPSAEVLRFNASSGVPIAVPPYLEQSPRARVRLETEWVGWSWRATP